MQMSNSALFGILVAISDREYYQAAERMPIPDSQTLLLPVLQVFADNAEHSNEEIWERMRLQFKLTPDELLQKYPTGKPVFHVNVALALANLQGAPHGGSKLITKVRNKGRMKFYRITEYGKAILNRNPSDLTIKEL
jgi:restriction endonuclease Mrr